MRSFTSTPNAKSKLEFTGSHIAKLEKSIAKHMVEDNEVLVVHQKPAFREMIDTAIAFGADVGKGVFKHPGKKRMRDVTIPDVIASQDSTTEMKQFDANIDTFGATLVSDGKDDVTKDHLINYVTVTPEGFRWESCKDVSGIRRKSEWVSADLLKQVAGLEGAHKKRRKIGHARVVEEEEEDEDDVLPSLIEELEDIRLGLEGDDEEALDEAESEQARAMCAAFFSLHADGDTVLNNYVQVVTDTPSVNAKAWSLIETGSPHLLANPCIFHCINLFFKHTLKGDKSNRANPQAPIPEFEDAECWTKELEQFFTNVETPRACLLAECEAEWPEGGPRRMRKYSDTRAANTFKVWHRAVRIFVCLERAVTSRKFLQWEASLKTSDEKARCLRIREIPADSDRWTSLKAFISALTPVYKLLRFVDGFTPATGKVYYRSLRVEEHFNQLVEENPDTQWCGRLREFWAADWNYMHVDIHSLGFCCDPEYHSHLKDMGSGVWEEFVRCAERMLQAAPQSRGFTIDQLTDEYMPHTKI